MAFIEGAARVAETAAAPGTATFTLAGAVTDYRAFSAACANTDTIPYVAVCPGIGWEKGIGTWATGGTLARTLILESTNAGAAVNFTGTTTIFGAHPGLANLIHNAASKTPPVDNDELSIWDSVGLVLKKLTWANLKAALNTATVTFTNKRVTPRITTSGSSATPTINTDNCDIHQITALAVAITSMTTNLTGTPVEGDDLVIEITGTATRAITWGAKFEASTVALPTTTSGTNKLSVAFLYNAVSAKWRCMGQC